MRSIKKNIPVAAFLAANIFFFSGLNCFAGTLYGGVAHSDFLTPVEPAQRIEQPMLAPQQGAALPETINPTVGTASRATLQHPAIEWFPIPKWMAGRWSKKGDTTTNVTDLRTGITTTLNQYIEDYMTVNWGHQADSQGNVWHANFVPSVREGESQGKNVSFTIVNLKVIEATPESLATRIHYIVRETQGRQLADIFQQESLTHYKSVGGPEKMDAISSNRIFSYQRPAKT